VIPAADWRRVGYNELESRVVERLQRDMKHLHREKEGVMADAIHLCPQNDAGERMWAREWRPVRHHELLLPHWQRFARVLAERREDKIVVACFRLPPPVLGTILPSMRGMAVICLVNCGLGTVGVRRLSSFLGRNSSLRVLVLGLEGLDLDAAGSFSEALRCHPSLLCLALEECGLDDGPVLGRILEGCGDVNAVRFSENSIGAAGVAVLAGFVGCNHSRAKCLGLDHNSISDADVPHLVDSLRRNSALTRLDVRKNRLTERGNRDMMKAVIDATDVTSVLRSNHVCQLRLFEDADRPASFGELAAMLAINDDTGLRTDRKIRKKVIFALAHENPGMLTSLLRHFDDTPLGLVPRILELVQKPHDYQFVEVDDVTLEKGSLSRIFLALRGWRMPLLFEIAHRPSKVAGRKRKRKRSR